jgi:nucleotide-binding universal stress UspA family protein
MKRIIVPIDFSKESLTGLNLSIMLAETTGAGIQMIHVIEKKTNESDESYDKDSDMAKLNFEGIFKKYKERYKNKIDLSYTIQAGKIFKEVTKQADKYDADVIVLSTHGGSGFEELFIGGNAYKITSTSRKPVITIRKERIPSTIKKIVLPLDISLETREKVPYTVQLAKMFRSEVLLVTVRSSRLKSIEKKLHKYADQVGLYLDTHEISYEVNHLHGGNISDMIIDYANSVNADLISIMTEQEKSFTNLLLGTYAHQMINKACIPVLSFPTHHLGNFRRSGDYSF